MYNWLHLLYIIKLLYNSTVTTVTTVIAEREEVATVERGSVHSREELSTVIVVASNGGVHQ